MSSLKDTFPSTGVPGASYGSEKLLGRRSPAKESRLSAGLAVGLTVFFAALAFHEVGLILSTLLVAALGIIHTPRLKNGYGRVERTPEEQSSTVMNITCFPPSAKSSPPVSSPSEEKHFEH